MADKSDKPRERCDAPIEVMFYPDAGAVCNRWKGHDGEHRALLPLDADLDEAISATIPAAGASGVVPATGAENEDDVLTAYEQGVGA